MELKGKVFRFGDDVDTDLIIPARYLNQSDPAHLAAHCMEDADPAFAKNVKPGDFIVAGKNFGCGSSREHAPISIKAAGVACVIAKSYARIFYRNAFNMGLTILECPDTDQIKEGAELSVDLAAGRITDLSSGRTFTSTAIPPFMRELVAAGGLMSWMSRRLTAASS